MYETCETRNLAEKVMGKAHQFSARLFGKSLFCLPKGFRGVSFCFDDFPATAGEHGAEKLEEVDARGTFYTCFGLLGTEDQGGRLASLEQILDLNRKGHEIACHTHDHINCSFSSTIKSVESCKKNIRVAAASGLILKNFSYPQGGMRLSTKKFIRSRYKSARGVCAGLNQDICDIYCLKSAPLYEAEALRIRDLIDSAACSGGWLILHTHDIGDAPSGYGISIGTFNSIVDYCLKKGLALKTVDETLKVLLPYSAKTI